jgi:hypothetical protein
MAKLTPFVRPRWWDANGTAPLAGGLLYSYAAGTTTPKATYTDSTGAVANANPVVLDAAGYADVWLGEGDYKLELKTAAGVTVWGPVDYVKGMAGEDSILGVTTIAALRALAAGAAAYVQLAGHTTAGDGGGGLFRWEAALGTSDDNGIIIRPGSAPALGRWVRQYSGAVNVKWYGATGNGVSSDQIAVAAAAAYLLNAGGGDLLIPRGTYLLTGAITFGDATSRVRVVMESMARFTSAVSANVTFYDFQGASCQHFAGSVTAIFQSGADVWLNPQWWGARGNGTNDDAPAIRAAVAALGPNGRLRLPRAPSYYRLESVIEIADKQGVTIDFGGAGDTSSGYSYYPFKYEGANITGYANAIFRILGCSFSRFNGLGIDQNDKAEYALWFSGLNAYTGGGITTGNRYRSVGCRFDGFANLNSATSVVAKKGARIGEDTAGSSQTDLFTFTNSFFRAIETSPQLSIDASPTTRGVECVGANTYGKFDHCEASGDTAYYLLAGTYRFVMCYALGNARNGWFINSMTSSVTLDSCHAEGLLGRPVYIASGDQLSSRVLKIIGGTFLPGSKATQTFDGSSASIVSVASDTISLPSHPFVTDDIAIYDKGAGTVIGALVHGQKYWVEKVDANTIKLRSSLGGSAINLSGLGSAAGHTLTWRPAPMRFNGNMNVIMEGVFAEDFLIPDTGATNDYPVFIDWGSKWLHPTDYSGNADAQVARFSSFSDADKDTVLKYFHNLYMTTEDDTSGPATLANGRSFTNVLGVAGAGGNTITLPPAKKGMMGIRVWKRGSATLIVQPSTGSLYRHDTGATAADVRAASSTERGFIQFDAVEDGVWECSSLMILSYGGSVPYLTATATWDPANLAADGDAVSTTIAVPGALTTDKVVASHDQIGANNVLISAHVQAADTVRVTLMNKTGGALNIASGTLSVRCIR